MEEEKKTTRKDKRKEPATLTQEETEAFLRDFIAAATSPEQADSMFSVFMLLIDFVKKGCGPYVVAELVKDYQEKTGNAGSLAEVANYAAALTNEERQEIADRGIKAYKQRKESGLQALDNSQAPPIRAEKLPLMLGKIETRIWNLLEQETTGQIVFDLAGPAKKNTPPAAPAFYSINFDELDKDEALRKIVHQLTPTDKRVYIAIAGLYAAGNTSMTYTQIYYAMGKTGKPGLSDREKIESSIRKMTHAFITINDEKAAAALGRQSYPLESPLLPAILAPMTDESRKLKGEERGRVAPLIEPPLITYARRYNQITTLPIKLLQGPISKTDSGIALEDYLLETIAHAKRAHKTTEVRTYDTIAQRIRQTERKQRARLPEKVLRLLDYYKECEHIKGYNERPDGVEILL